jgi:hypothetical protein
MNNFGKERLANQIASHIWIRFNASNNSTPVISLDANQGDFLHLQTPNNYQDDTILLPDNFHPDTLTVETHSQANLDNLQSDPQMILDSVIADSLSQETLSPSLSQNNTSNVVNITMPRVSTRNKKLPSTMTDDFLWSTHVSS